MSNNKVISVPASGLDMVRQIEAGDLISFTFTSSENNLHPSRDGVSLRLDFDNGSSVMLQDFFRFSDVTLEFADTRLSSEAFLLAFAPELAVAATAESTGNGLNPYEDDPGTLLVGVDRLEPVSADIQAASAPTTVTSPVFPAPAPDNILNTGADDGANAGGGDSGPGDGGDSGPGGGGESGP
ncbi:MAG: hypothetical protein LBD82_03635, partial [Deltaproteobacteria bacterium]|nr:hypothetical protein [Deltaproteobacteria bacterium]